jgi:hypothetical protein
MILPLHIRQAVLSIASRLNGIEAQWLIGGSCGLLLQGVKVAKVPRDLDMYADTGDAAAIADRLADLAVDAPQYSETDIYRSVLSHYRLGDAIAELVGGFQVISEGSIYTVEASYLRSHHAVVKEIDGLSVPLMPLAHELIFNMLRNRPDRYEAIASVMKAQPERHFPALDALVKRNTISKPLIDKINRLLQTDYF